MRGTVKITGELEARVRTLLGGDNPTPRRVTALLEELEQRRTLPREAPPDPAPTGDAAADPIPASESAEPAEPAAWAEERRVLYKTLLALEAKVEELRRPATVEDREQAIGAGRLPPPGVTASPLGDPTSPLGPRVFYKICECGDCTPFRKYHWWCVICRSGPHHYQGRYPHFTKVWLQPGGISGVAHHSCSEPCRLQYLGLIGVAPGVNDHEPPSAPVVSGAAPSRPQPAYDSD